MLQWRWLPAKPLARPFGFTLGYFPACGTNLASFCLAQGLHSASIPGILALDLCPSDTNKILTGKGATSLFVVSTDPSTSWEWGPF